MSAASNPAQPADRADRVVAVAGWAAMVGLLLMTAGMIVAVAAAVAYSLAQQLADRYRQAAEVDE